MKKSKDTYDAQNEGFITHSKLQCFLTTPIYYKLRFIDKVIPPRGPSEPLLIGSAFDAWMQGEDVFDKGFEVVERRVDVEKQIETLENKTRDVEAEILALSADKEDKRAPGKIETRQRYLKDYAEEIEKLRKRAGKFQINETQFQLIKDMEAELNRQPLFSFDKNQCQAELVTEYSRPGSKVVHKLRGSLDQLRPDQDAIRDLKTCAKIDGLFRTAQLHDQGGQTQFIRKYLDQLTWYQWLDSRVNGRELNGIIDAVSKENPPRSEFFFASAEELKENRAQLIEKLDQLCEAIELDIWPVPDRRTLMRTPAYGYSDFDLQTNFTPLA